jgi:metal-responsive CopG/Arc/MetJ family transcriptional regulator
MLIPREGLMPKTKIAVTLDAEIVRRVDRLVLDSKLPSRSSAIEAAVAGHFERLERTRLASACALLDPVEERALAEEGLSLEADSWPNAEG